MELRRYAHLLRRRILLIALAVIVGMVGGYLVTNRTPSYQTQATIYVGSRQFAAVVDSPDASAAMDRFTQTFAAMIKSSAIAGEAIGLYHVPRTASQAQSETTVDAVANTNYIVVFVSDRSPVVAQELANGEAQSFVAEVASFEPGVASSTGPTAATSVFASAPLPSAPQPTSTKRHVALGALFGLVVGLALAALLNYLDLSVKTPEGVERDTQLPVLGTIPILSTPAAGR